METFSSEVSFLGSKFIDSKAIAKALTPGGDESTEFTSEQKALNRIMQSGHFLAERTNIAPDGSPLTMQYMVSRLQDEFIRRDLGQILYKPSRNWLETQAFYMEDTPRSGLFVVSEGVVPGTLKADCGKQTGILKDHILDLTENLSAEGKEAIREWEDGKDDFAKLLKSDWKNAAEQWVDFKFNKLYIPRPVDVLYDLISPLLTSGVRRLQGIYTRTCQLSSDGRVVSLGYFDPVGADVIDWGPDFGYPRIGLCLSAELKDLGF